MKKGALAKNDIPRTVEKVDWPHWRYTEHAVLCFVKKNDSLLLIHKKTGLGKGKVNAPGGRIEVRESPKAAAVRETKEETGILASELSCVAHLHFIFTNGYSLQGIVFFANLFEGIPIETKEAKPFWCRQKDIPYEKMWEDDKHWLPKALDGEFVKGYFIFEDDKMLSMRLKSFPSGENKK